MLRRILITGPESTGKSWLSQKLAQHFQTLWVPEMARTYLDQLDRPYRESDLLEIARLQRAEEERRAKQAQGWLFCDTGMLVLKIWSLHKFGRCHPWILRELEQSRYAHILLTDIDLPWEPDPQREHPHLREFLFDWYVRELQEQKLAYSRISGQGELRFQQALSAVNQLKG
jgi:NadR type nicotinamide-nucleotide adenylyltransferase